VLQSVSLSSPSTNVKLGPTQNLRKYEQRKKKIQTDTVTADHTESYHNNGNWSIVSKQISTPFRIQEGI
jgi:hypothetical protein